MAKPFVHLHVHTKYSMLDGACHVKDLCRRAKELGMPALAMTDHGVMYGMVEFIKCCKEFGIKPIIGCEMYINGKGSRFARNKDAPYQHLILLAETDEGYKNLARLNTIAHMEGFYYKPRIDKEVLRKHAKGLIGLSACLAGEVNELLAEGRIDEAEKVAGEYVDIFGKNNFFLEMQDHGIPEQKEMNKNLRVLMQRTGLRTVITNDVHYLYESHAEAHEVMLCIQTSTTMSDPKRMKYYGTQFYFKSREELEKAFPDDEACFDLTVEIAERCHAAIEMDKIHFPSFALPEGFTNDKDYLIHLGLKGLERNYQFDPKKPETDFQRDLMKRFDYEIGVIEKTGFINYFLVVQDFVNYSLEHGIPVGPGRGSGAGSLLAYSLNITRIDPIRFDLIFERFLNPDRVSPPDFDIDFCQTRRERTIQYVKEKYGSDRVAQIVTFNQLGAKSIVRDIARVLEIPLLKSNDYCKLIPEDPKMTLAKAKNENPQFGALCQSDPDLRRIMRYAEVLEGLCRGAGVHAAGVVIGDQPLIEIIPLGRDKDGSPVTQYAKEAVEECGLLKMDFLGLKTLTVLQEAVDIIKALHGIEIDLDKLPLDDEKTFALFRRGDTVGVFQFESSGMQKYLIDLAPTRIEEIIAMNALYRPGPMDNIPAFIRRKKGEEKIVYDHPLLEPVVKETYGIIVYQEQVQRAANVLAGYSLGQADLLRRAMGKKKVEVMQKERAQFIEGCANVNGIPPETAGQIFDNIEKFAGYGFNKAHAAAYSVVAYQTAYLKAHYPAEFMAAQISSEIGNFDKLPGFVSAASDMGLSILPPDVNRSSARFKPEGKGLRFGLAGIKSVGEGAADAIISECAKGGPFKNLIEFCIRVDAAACNKRVLEALARCGAFDSFGNHRAQLFGCIDFALARAQSAQAEKASGQISLFESASDPTQESLPRVPEWSEKESLAGERELLGIYLTGHPLDRYKTIVRDFSSVRLGRITKELDEQTVRVAAFTVSATKRLSKNTKEMWAVLLLDDGETKMEVLAFPKTYAKCAEHCIDDLPVLVTGRVSNKDDQLKIIADEVLSLSDAPASLTEQIVFSASDENVLKAIHILVGHHPGDTPFLVFVRSGKKKVVVRPRPGGIAVTSEFLKEAGETLKPDALRFLTRSPVQRFRYSARAGNGNE